ncbi:MAG: hotdog fold thioesterase [Sedimentisphaerales bacterium]|nr:hotdog fold thioesterase [Sedimentisphaerales bacterium]
MERIKEYFKKDMFAKHCGIVLMEVSKGSAKVKMDITPDHINGVGIVQGGAIFTLADLAFAMASNSYGTVAVAINVNISFIKAINKGTLYAQASETSMNPKLATYDVRVTDDADNLIALFQGMVYRKEKKLEEV